MIYHLCHLFFWKCLKWTKRNNPYSRGTIFIFGNCMSKLSSILSVNWVSCAIKIRSVVWLLICHLNPIIVLVWGGGTLGLLLQFFSKSLFYQFRKIKICYQKCIYSPIFLYMNESTIY